MKVIECLVTAACGIPGEALDQGLGDLARDGEAQRHVGEGAVGGLIVGLATIDAVETTKQRVDGDAAVG